MTAVDARAADQGRQSMIPKSGYRFSDKISSTKHDPKSVRRFSNEMMLE